MPTRLLKLKPQETERLRLSWHCSWKKVVVYWDSQLITTFCQSEPIEEWQSVLLPTGDTLAIRFMISLGRTTLEAMCNERILARIDVGAPHRILDRAFTYMQVIAGIHFAAILPIFRVSVLTKAIWEWVLLLGSIYIGLSLLPKSSKRIALIIASVLYVFEGSYLGYLWITFIGKGGFSYMVTLWFYISALYYALQGLRMLASPKCT